MGRLFLYGASGHAKVIIETLESLGTPPSGLFDDNRTISALLGYPVNQFPATFEKDNDFLILSIGNNVIRNKIEEKLSVNFSSAIHPSATISKRCKVDIGTVIMAGVSMNSEVTIGKHCIINTNSSIDHDCILEDFVHVSPNVALCGNVFIGEGTHIGAGSVIIPGIKIGKWCIIGAGSVVVKDIPDNAKAFGNPCRIIPA